MKKMLCSIAIPAALALGGLLATTHPAAAHGGYGVVVRAPHAAFAFGVGNPAFPTGYVLARPYARRVFYRRPYGYGFWAPVPYGSFNGIRHRYWIPVRRYRTGWIVVSPRRYPYRSRY
jgi:hypothetical protein